MPQASREIKRRIKSINNTKKITKAMELVSAAKMRKAVNNVLASRSYSTLAWQTIVNLAERTDKSVHPLLHKRKVKKIAVIVVTSNRGLCGSFNSQLVSECVNFLKEGSDKVKMDLILIGNKSKQLVYRYKLNAIAEFEKFDVTTKIEEIRPLAKLVIDEYKKGSYDKVVMAYTDYISSLRQVPKVRQLLPLERGDDTLGSIGEEISEETMKSEIDDEYIFEPTPDQVLEELLPRMVEIQIYQAILESDASEHSARMLAMRNATDAAAEMIDDLTLAYNQARQAGITQEIAEISTSMSVIE